MDNKTSPKNANGICQNWEFDNEEDCKRFNFILPSNISYKGFSIEQTNDGREFHEVELHLNRICEIKAVPGAPQNIQILP